MTLNSKLNAAYEEIYRLKSQLKNKDYNIDKLELSVRKNSTNSGISTSKEPIKSKTEKTGANAYNHRNRNSNKTGGQIGHKGDTPIEEDILTRFYGTIISDHEVGILNMELPIKIV